MNECESADACGGKDAGKCTDEEGSFSCECNFGFLLVGNKCSDVNECTDQTAECYEGEQCKNTAGDYECVCKPNHTKCTFGADDFYCLEGENAKCSTDGEKDGEKDKNSKKNSAFNPCPSTECWDFAGDACIVREKCVNLACQPSTVDISILPQVFGKLEGVEPSGFENATMTVDGEDKKGFGISCSFGECDMEYGIQSDK